MPRLRKDLNFGWFLAGPRRIHPHQDAGSLRGAKIPLTPRKSGKRGPNGAENQSEQQMVHLAKRLGHAGFLASGLRHRELVAVSRNSQPDGNSLRADAQPLTSCSIVARTLMALKSPGARIHAQSSRRTWEVVGSGVGTRTSRPNNLVRGSLGQLGVSLAIEQLLRLLQKLSEKQAQECSAPSG